MKKYRVGFRPQAEADLFGLYRYIAEHSGEAVAGALIDRTRQPAWRSRPSPRAAGGVTIFG